ncbi:MULTISPECIES: type II toxin-antitoxin system VapC family toxin [Hyphomicrobiales]|uniref:Ribonuclease VapC n=1 Tax=Bosea massiliensis TaxID=151419 RepID=A0ABW0P603_9HYPH|nr:MULTISPECIES: type II toxin-antitoxin system VapC family toxin [Hyphomicrobiales]
MFLDASVLVAAMAGEVEAPAIRVAIVESEKLASSPLAVFEASCRIAKLRRISIDEAYSATMEFLTMTGAQLQAIDAETGRAAHTCAARYHLLTGHPARLNMGDCFAYAAARASGLKLAYKGNDFLHTDIDGVRFGPEAEPPRA